MLRMTTTLGGNVWRRIGAVSVLSFVLALSACDSSSNKKNDNGNEDEDQALVLSEIREVDGIAVANGTPLESVLEQLPETVILVVSDGEEETQEAAAIEWRLSETVKASRGDLIMDQVYYPTARGDYEFTGTFELPEGVAQPDEPLDLEVRTLVTVEGGALLEIDNEAAFNKPGTYNAVTLTFPSEAGPDVERSFVYYVPSDDSPNHENGMPLMFTFHGAGSYGEGQLFYSEFDRVAEEHGFMVVAPDHGFSVKGVFLQPALPDFTSAIIDYLLDQGYDIDERRIYSSGISMGGMASQTLALELHDRIAAIAPVAIGLDTIYDDEAPLSETIPRPMTVVSFYGTQDNQYPGNFYEVLPYLADHNNADETPVIESLGVASDDDITNVERFTYANGDNGTEVIFYRIENGGHTWPGTYQYASLLTVGLTTQHIHATDLIWEHLSKHTLPETD